jgi:dTDP-4-dehydrorhamnose 3,5-epimerase
VKATPTGLPGVLLIEPAIARDDRGLFYESYNRRDFHAATGIDVEFVQDNHSSSVAGVLRGLHYQYPRAQGKLVRVLAGEVFDVAVDLRRGSPSFGRWEGIVLSATGRRMLWIPPGYAHGFLVLSDTAEVAYKVTDYWSRADERCLAWNDPALAIDWPLRGAPILSAKDRGGTPLADCQTYP